MIYKFFTVFTLTALLLLSYAFCQKIALNGEWKLVNSNGSISINAKVPGSMYTALWENKIIDDPYYRFNDVTTRWAAYDEWTFSRQFEISDAINKQPNIELLCGGLDTIATIMINGQVVGTANNQFRRYVFDIKKYVKVGTNSISVKFASPVKYAAKQASAYSYVVPPECTAPAQNGECHANFIRKSQCSFSWDWGPAFPTMGIWRNITLEAYGDVAMRYVAPQPLKGMGAAEWVLVVYVEFGLTDDKTHTGYLDISIEGIPDISNSRLIHINKTNLNTTALVPIGKGAVKTWWPNGYGEQPLYNIIAKYSPMKSYSQVMKKVRFGFRTVEIAQNPVPSSPGLSFYFKINGFPIFMKGSNWIPADSFQERITPSYLRRILQSAKDAHMNMLRVWGGGIYESEAFYSICDELGIMIWQDLMFACAMYPANTDFLQNARQEFVHQVLRLQRHPSIAVWSGNNENEAALAQNWYGTKPKFEAYKKDYLALYIDTAKDVITKLDKSRPFIGSSPTNGVESEREGWVAQNPADTHFGDMHWYDYSADGWSWKSYPRTRFASEFGYEAWSSFETVAKVSVKEDWSYYSNFSLHRQHHPNGNDQMLKEAAKHINLPTGDDEVQQFKDLIYVTQINQAMGVKTEVEFNRRMQSLIVDGEGGCMGSLYWQLNDIWQCPSWASIEYGGKWKMLQYYALKFYNRTIISPYIEADNKTVSVYYIEDKLPMKLPPHDHHPDTNLKFKPRDGAKGLYDVLMDVSVDDANQVGDSREPEAHSLFIDVYSWDGTPSKPLMTYQENFWNPQIASTKVMDFQLTEEAAKAAGCTSLSHCFLHFYLDNPDNYGPSNWLTPVELKDAQGMKKANTKIIDVKHVEDRTFSFTVTTDAIAPFVWMEATGIQGRFCCNGYMMVEASIKHMFYAWEDTTVEKLQAALKVTSLMDIYR
ncbi:unnamed protein product [Owenia fusiformis]|uniref:beta-mannosidase n=1 Tax=Owenia fusiformis TaxID=6347 RepID=A0A8S4N3B5_OWEFU|nr:unnamed protein product [Owenia fusiformis]